MKSSNGSVPRQPNLPTKVQRAGVGAERPAREGAARFGEGGGRRGAPGAPGRGLR